MALGEEGGGGSQIQLRAIRAAASVSPPSLAETHLVPSSICPSSWCTCHRRRDSVSIIIPLCLSPLSFRAAEMRKRERRQTWFSVRIIPLPHNLKKFGRPDFPLFQMQISGEKGKKVWCYFHHGRGKGLRRGDHDFPPLFLYVRVHIVPHSVSQHYIAGNNSPQLSCAKILFFLFLSVQILWQKVHFSYPPLFAFLYLSLLDSEMVHYVGNCAHFEEC